MALEDTPSIISYAGNDSTVTAYPLPFVFFSDDDIALYVDGVLSADTFSIIGDKFAGTASAVTDVAYTSSPEQTVTFQREVSYDQPTVLPGSGRTDPTTLERAYDYLSMQIQQVAREVEESPKAAPGDTTPGGSFSEAANTTVGQDANGDLVMRSAAEEVVFLGIGISVDAAVASAAAALVSETNAATSETNAAASEANAAASEAAALDALDAIPASLSASNTFTIATNAAVGSILLTFDGGGVFWAGPGDQDEAAQGLADLINAGVHPVTATATGNILRVVAKLPGDDGNGISCVVVMGGGFGSWAGPETTGGSISNLVLTSTQSLTSTQKAQVRDNIGLALTTFGTSELANPVKENLALQWPEAVAGSQPSGPFSTVKDARQRGVEYGDTYYDDSLALRVNVVVLSNEVSAHYAQFENDVPLYTKERLSNCIAQLKAADLWGDLIQFVPFGTKYQPDTGTTLYAVKGNDMTGTTVASAGDRQTFGASVTFALPTTDQDPRQECTSVNWVSKLSSSPASGQIVTIQNSTVADGKAQFWWDGGGLRVTTSGDGYQDIPFYSPATTIGSVSTMVAFMSNSVDDLECTASIDDGAIFDVPITHGVTARDLTINMLSDDLEYSGTAVFDKVLSLAERQTFNTILRETIFNMPLSVVHDGDSIIAGTGGITPSWMARAVASTGVDMVSFSNIATGGHTTVDILAGVATGLAGIGSEPSGAAKWYLFNGATNDISRAWTGTAGSWEAADVYDRLKDIAAAARSAGRLAAIYTPLKRSDTSPTSPGALYNDRLMEIRDMILADDGTFFDGVIDLHKHFYAANSTYQNSVLLSDGLHPFTDAAQDLMSNALLEWYYNI